MFCPFSELGTCNFCEAQRLGVVIPQYPSWCPVTLSFGEPSTAGRQLIFSWVASSRGVKSHLGNSDVVCRCGCTGEGLFAPQSSCPGSSRRQGRTCRTPPWACSVSRKSDATLKKRMLFREAVLRACADSKRRSSRLRRWRQGMRWRNDCGASALFLTHNSHADLTHQASSQCRCVG